MKITTTAILATILAIALSLKLVPGFPQFHSRRPHAAPSYPGR
jgi:hypothetical protein